MCKPLFALKNQQARDVALTFEIPVRRIPTAARATIREPIDDRMPEVITKLQFI